MKFHFKTESFSFETLRAIGFATDGGADIGDVLTTIARIRDGNEDEWLSAWSATADRVAAIGEASLASGNRVSAREAFLRASNYYRTAEFFRRTDPAHDTTARRMFDRSHETFLSAARLLDGPFREVTIPYESTTLPAHLFLVDDSGVPRPTIVYNSGFDSTCEEAYFAIGAAALRRGYNVLAFDGPGQGAALRKQGVVFRHDWENVITPVLDFLQSVPEVDATRITLFGYSLGAYLVARAAAHDDRPEAIVLDDGIFDFHEAFRKALPAFLRSWIYAGRDALATPFLRLRMRTDTSARWGVGNGMWTFGASSPAEFIRMTQRYTLDGLADRIRTRALILSAEEDHFLQGQPERLNEAMTCTRKLVTLTAAEGAGEHCHMGSMARMHQVMFDWLASPASA